MFHHNHCDSLGCRRLLSFHSELFQLPAPCTQSRLSLTRLARSRCPKDGYQDVGAHLTRVFPQQVYQVETRGRTSTLPSAPHLVSDRRRETLSLLYPRRSASNDRPTTAGGLVEGRSRKKLKLDLNAARPRTSEGHTSIIGPSTQAAKSHEDLIGVAYGSPSHPPMAFYSMNGRMSPGSPNPVFRSASPFPEHSQTLQPTKWKKIGAMFKARHGLKHGKDLPSLNSRPAMSQKQGFNISNEHLPKHHWFKPRQNMPERPHRAPPPIPAEDDAEAKVCERSHSEDSGYGKTMLLDSTPTPSPGLIDEAQKPIGGEPKALSNRPTRLSSLPKLEVQIPNRKEDDSDIVTRSLAAKESSNLLARRSRTLESLKSGSSSRDSSTEDRQSNSKKRMSTPTMPKLPFKHAAASSPSSAKYSLFPSAAATPVKIVGRIPAPEDSIKRSFSSPGRLSPMSDSFSKNKFGPSQAKKTGMSSEQAVTSPGSQYCFDGSS